ncbi:hypothetical protein CVU37_01405 [candidate division BRC1 bacterium HGW-BRC1-1]|jgi:N-acetylmuramoyl-L-alanine amidase|nr:MAG: hypothetical protein CVU37_01405 [candidate division BRC1 bacterium HGW-BRC1-1]
MKRTTLALTVAAFALTTSCFAVTAKICIDPGHGGSDPGAGGFGQSEATNVLNTSLKFKTWLDKDTNDAGGGGSWSVVMTRSTDVYVSLQGRCDVANNAGANRFMCIHNNAFNTTANGTETFCSPTAGTTTQDLRNKVQDRMIQAWGRANRGVKTAAYYVLEHTAMNAELAELAFVDNAGDSVYTGSATHQDTAAKYHLYAIQNHFGLTAYTPVVAQTYVVDNTSSGFSASTNWTLSTSEPGYYGTNYRARATGSVSDAAQWTATIATGGNYTMSAWWTSNANRAAAAPYILPDGTTVAKNQQTSGGVWNTLASKSLSSGANSIKLSCWTTAGYYVIADAVKFVGPN